MELSDAVSFGSLQDVADSLRDGANPNVPNRLGYSALRLAINKGDAQMAKLLLDHGAEVRARDADGNSALCQAVVKRRQDLIILLVDHGADIHGECDCGGVIAVAALGNDLALVELFASMGADVNAYNRDGFTPLMLAAGNDANGVIKPLLSNGAQLELRDKNHGLTAYLHAALAGNLAAAQMLLEAGADPGAAGDDGKTAAELARENGHHWDTNSGE
jgi:uncharacterized protein